MCVIDKREEEGLVEATDSYFFLVTLDTVFLELESYSSSMKV